MEEDFSFFHSPTLIKSNRIDALFTLIYEILLKRFTDPDGQFKNTISSIQNIKDKDVRVTQSSELAERAMVELLNLIKELEIIKFDEFSNTENERFKKEFSRTIEQITDRIS